MNYLNFEPNPWQKPQWMIAACILDFNHWPSLHHFDNKSQTVIIWTLAVQLPNNISRVLSVSCRLFCEKKRKSSEQPFIFIIYVTKILMFLYFLKNSKCQNYFRINGNINLAFVLIEFYTCTKKVKASAEHILESIFIIIVTFSLRISQNYHWWIIQFLYIC